MSNLFGNQSKSFLAELVKINKSNLLAFAYEKLTVNGTVVALTVPTGATYALITVESSLITPAIRYLELGVISPPSATDGLVRSNLDVFDVTGTPNLVNFRATQVAAGTHTLHIQYYK